MPLAKYTVNDNSGFQTEHAIVLERIADIKTAKKALHKTIQTESPDEEGLGANVNIHNAEIALQEARQAYFDAVKAMDVKIAEVFPIAEDVSDFYVALIPDENDHENSSDVLFFYPPYRDLSDWLTS